MAALPLPYGWDDLVVSEQTGAALRRLRAEVRLRQQVLDGWEFRRLCPSAAGVTALFAGPSGTGKTMAAQVLARELDLELYRVDLAGVVSKYIGETEKQLAAVFSEAERSNVLPFFD
ncbi:MAG: AAA family ATPase, partial [Actinobacteria bacterium]|nr:AAA family ATPase [Actinomycetota bacterium]